MTKEELKEKHHSMWSYILDFYKNLKDDDIPLETIKELKISWFYNELKNNPSLAKDSFYLDAFYCKEFLCSAFDGCESCPLQKISSTDMGYYVDCFESDMTFISMAHKLSNVIVKDKLDNRRKNIDALIKLITYILNCWD